MRKVFVNIGNWISKIIDFFYPPFRRYISPQVFRYAACGGANVVFDLVLYFIFYNFILAKQNLDLGFYTLSPHIASLAIVFPITTLLGFLLQKYVTFTTSHLRGSTQLFRYIMVIAANLLINIFGLKLLVDVLCFYPTPSKLAITVLTIIVSYICQKKFTFKTKTV